LTHTLQLNTLNKTGPHSVQYIRWFNNSFCIASV